ncbi:MAG TPA: hypothetical protein VKA84_25790 [Gemmatimonadaceae bacterium]|nr:hypothetical protein [Gemmatimonadaceae bacterium]
MRGTISLTTGRAARSALAALAAAASLTGPARAQQGAPRGAPQGALPASAAGEPARFLQRYIGLSAEQVEQARRGAVVTKVLDSADPEEIALFGIVAVDAPREQVVQRVRDLPSFLRVPGRTAFGLFGTPATPEDARAFVADPGDVEALRACKRGDCDVKMPTPRFDLFRSGVNWSSPDAGAQVSAHVRRVMTEYVTLYRRGGTAAMVEYGDQKTARRAGEVFASLLAESPYLFDYVPAFHDYLAKYPAAPLAGVTDAIYWSNDRLPSLRPILGVTHVSIYAPPGAPLTLVSAKQLYASHYFLGAFTLTTVLDRPEAPGGRGSYYMVVQRMRFDHLPSGGLLNIRGRVTGKMHEALRAELQQRKAGFEGK